MEAPDEGLQDLGEARAGAHGPALPEDVDPPRLDGLETRQFLPVGEDLGLAESLLLETWDQVEDDLGVEAEQTFGGEGGKSRAPRGREVLAAGDLQELPQKGLRAGRVDRAQGPLAGVAPDGDEDRGCPPWADAGAGGGEDGAELGDLGLGEPRDLADFADPEEAAEDAFEVALVEGEAAEAGAAEFGEDLLVLAEAEDQVGSDPDDGLEAGIDVAADLGEGADLGGVVAEAGDGHKPACEAQVGDGLGDAGGQGDEPPGRAGRCLSVLLRPPASREEPQDDEPGSSGEKWERGEEAHVRGIMDLRPPGFKRLESWALGVHTPRLFFVISRMLGAQMSQELPKNFDPQAHEKAVYQHWLERKCFRAIPDPGKPSYVIMMPLPNVTGALHMGHAMDNVMQDLLIRWHRMKGDDTLWQPGTDHAGIATQAVVEKRLFELEGKTRHDIGRAALVERIFAWKDEYQARIIEQQQKMGCSCDWDRIRFTMDPVCRAAVREMFFRMFSDGLIFRGNRLVNWDCHLHTAVSDDEIEHRTVQGHFWHLRYPVVEPREGEPSHVVVATTRPETMLGDTAVAVHPDPRSILGDREPERLALLETLVRMAREGRKVLVPLVEREVPLILDEWAKPDKGSGCVKITPAHDPNDYEVWQRHREEISAINILNTDGSLNERAGAYAGMDRFAARKKVVADLETQGFLEGIEDREIEVGHSDRSKTPIEPLLSKQWFVRMGDIEGGVLMGRGTAKEHRSPGLAQAAIDAVAENWRSPSGLRLRFHPERYEQTYVSWLREKRDWCISRQLWWGHRIPIWHASAPAEELRELLQKLPPMEEGRIQVLVQDPDGRTFDLGQAEAALSAAQDPVAPWEIQACLRNEEAERRFASSLEALGLAQDPDVLDTWFSSALWPQSTLGWPDPEHAPIEEGQTFLGSIDGRPSSLQKYYPGSCLVTGRDIITLWVARMVLAGLYNLGDLPFTDVFIHANILDGKGVRMSKSKGNGIDPLDIIDRYGADAMRYVLCEMQTGLQDIRLPVQAITPFHEEYVDLTKAKPGKTLGVYIDPKTGKEFDVIGTRKDLPQAKVISDRFEVGRNFCNKLWNALRFAMLNLERCPFEPLEVSELRAEDRWILSRLTAAIQGVEQGLEDYLPANAIQAARDFFWGELCDWYLELLKPRFQKGAEDPKAQQVLAFVLDQVLRLLHPALPFITEALYGHLGTLVPERGIDQPLPVGSLLIREEWPRPRTEWRDEELESQVAFVQEILRGVRDLRARYQVPPKKRLPAVLNLPGPKVALLEGFQDWILHLGGLSELKIGTGLERPELAATAVAQDCEISLGGVLDPVKERERLEKQKAKIEGHIKSLEGKLSNENFTSRAPAEVVERERARLQELKAELALVQSNLEVFL